MDYSAILGNYQQGLNNANAAQQRIALEPTPAEHFMAALRQSQKDRLAQEQFDWQKEKFGEQQDLQRELGTAKNALQTKLEQGRMERAANAVAQKQQAAQLRDTFQKLALETTDVTKRLELQQRADHWKMQEDAAQQMIDHHIATEDSENARNYGMAFLARMGGSGGSTREVQLINAFTSANARIAQQNKDAKLSLDYLQWKSGPGRGKPDTEYPGMKKEYATPEEFLEDFKNFAGNPLAGRTGIPAPNGTVAVKAPGTPTGPTDLATLVKLGMVAKDANGKLIKYKGTGSKNDPKNWIPYTQGQ